MTDEPSARGGTVPAYLSFPGPDFVRRASRSPSIRSPSGSAACPASVGSMPCARCASSAAPSVRSRSEMRRPSAEGAIILRAAAARASPRERLGDVEVRKPAGIDAEEAMYGILPYSAT